MARDKRKGAPGKMLELHPRTQGVPDNRPKRKGPATFTDKTIAEIAAVANELGIEPATLIAVAEVESGGKAFASVETRHEPLIRFEGHYFDQRLAPAERDIARKAGLASPVAGKIANPVTQIARWRMLDRAAAINRRAA